METSAITIGGKTYTTYCMSNDEADKLFAKYASEELVIEPSVTIDELLEDLQNNIMFYEPNDEIIEENLGFEYSTEPGYPPADEMDPVYDEHVRDEIREEYTEKMDKEFSRIMKIYEDAIIDELEHIREDLVAQARKEYTETLWR